MSRTGMSELISLMRLNTNLVGATATWTDDILEGRLDRYRTTLKDKPLRAVPEYIAGTTTYLEYSFEHLGTYFEQGTATGSGWALRDSDGDEAPTYTPNYNARIVLFDTDTAGSAYFLSCRVYDVNRASADVWRERAAEASDEVDFDADGQRFSASQWHAHCMAMVSKFMSQASTGRSNGFVRSDLVRGW